MGLFDRLFNRTNDVEVEEIPIEKKPETLADLAQDDRNHLVEFNAEVANAVRYPKTAYDAKVFDGLLHEELQNSGDVKYQLNELAKYEFGKDGFSSEFHHSNTSISETLANEMEDGKTTTLHELFDVVNRKYSPNEVMYSGVVPYENASREEVQDAACFVHDGDTLDDVIKRTNDVYANVEEDFGVSREQFAKFSNIEDAFQEGLEMVDDEEFAKRYNNYFSPDFHSAKDLSDYLDDYVEIHNMHFDTSWDENIDAEDKAKNDDRLISKDDVNAFAEFATGSFSNLEKENGIALSQILRVYDDVKDEYFENTVSFMQATARAETNARLTTRYDYISEQEAPKHQKAIDENEAMRLAAERAKQEAKAQKTPHVEPKVAKDVTPTKTHKTSKQVEDDLEP